jgi:carbohydrate diacid regulator
LLTPELAQEIASETSRIVGFNILVTDRDGIVIGSGDESRVGGFHEASVEVVRTVQAAAHDAAQAGRLHGVKPGITLPITVDGVVVGTVGITGTPRVVRQFGLVVRRQTEILLRESTLVRSRLVRENAVADLVRDVGQYDPEVLDPQVLVLNARELGFDLLIPRVAVVVQTDQPVLRVLREIFNGPQDIVAATGAGRFGVLSRNVSTSDVLTTCGRISGAVGVGGVAHSVADLHESYRDASTAARLGGQGVHSIDDFRLPELLAGIPQRAKARFLAAVNVPPDLRPTVTAWCESGYHLVRAAQTLHIHRNTLIYRLDKIERETGKDPRNPRVATSLYLACLLQDR